MNYLEKITDMYQMIGENKSFEALDKYYHDDVVVVEANGEERKGKEAQHKAMQEWYASIEAFHAGGAGAITSNEETGTTSVESWFDITFKGNHRMKMEEVGIQKWQDGKIIHERFYYNIPPGMEG